MSLFNICRLCRNFCNNGIDLCNDNGEFTDVYNITIKFFPFTFLDMEHNAPHMLPALCVECWQHISSFNNFQQKVLLTQAKLLNDATEVRQLNHTGKGAALIPNIESAIKIEEEFVSLSEVELKPEPNKGQLVVTDCEVKFQTNIKETRSDTISIASTLEDSQGDGPIEFDHDHDDQDVDEEFEEPVGAFVGGEFNNNDQNSDDISFSELEAIEVAFNSDDSNDVQILEYPLDVGKASASVCRQQSSNKSSKKKKRKSASELEAIIALWKPSIECDICSESFATFTLIQNHFVQQHPNNEFYISCCGRKFRYRCRIEQHALNHIHQKTIKSPSAAKASVSATDQSSYHMKEKKRRKTAPQLDAVIALWKPSIECDLCSEPCASFTLLQNHFVEKHPNDEFFISCCGRKFKYRCRIEQHALFHIDPKAFMCPLCNKCFSIKNALTSHMFHIHPNVKELDSPETGYNYEKERHKHECLSCGKTFAAPSRLRDHMATHTGEHIHACSYCDKTFQYSSSIWHHLKTVHPDKVDRNKTRTPKFGCPHCPQVFQYRARLHYHLRVRHPNEFVEKKPRSWK